VRITHTCNCTYQPILCQVIKPSGMVYIKRREYEAYASAPALFTCPDCGKRWIYADGEMRRYEPAQRTSVTINL
jgi:predicted RNA-binding Zn-ribbon protein involved in translation (DUF1610 family)